MRMAQGDGFCLRFADAVLSGSEPASQSKRAYRQQNAGGSKDDQVLGQRFLILCHIERTLLSKGSVSPFRSAVTLRNFRRSVYHGENGFCKYGMARKGPRARLAPPDDATGREGTY